MIKRLIPLFALVTAGAASAQSSVTLFGVVDANLQSARQAGVTSNRMVGSGSNLSNRLGFRGVEDLGGGLSSSFWLESSLQVDNGAGAPAGPSADNQTAGGANVPLMFDRRATIGLASATAGEIRLGRDYVPSFYNLSQYDPFSYVGAGSASTIAAGGLTQVGLTQISVRASNSISYFTPASLGGFYGQAMYALGENPSNAAGGKSHDGNYAGLRLGYSKSALEVSAAYAKLRLASGDVTVMNGGAGYDFGWVKLGALLTADRKDATVVNAANDSRGWLLSSRFVWQNSTIPVSYGRVKDNSNAISGSREASKFAVGYVYNLSKRTAVYTTYAVLRNKNGAALTGGGTPGVANASWTALDVGVRTSF